MFISLNIKLKITNKENKTEYKESLRTTVPIKTVSRYALQVMFVGYIVLAILAGSLLPLGLTETVYATSGDQFVEVDYDELKNQKKVEKPKVDNSLEDKYRALGGSHYYSNVEPYLTLIDKVLKERGLDNDALFIQAMFFIGQHESHWNTMSISGSSYGGEHPTGIFQFLPSTFRSVSRGNIFDAEDQIRAYVAMIEAGRAREYGTLYIPTINPEAKAYVLNYK